MKDSRTLRAELSIAFATSGQSNQNYQVDDDFTALRVDDSDESLGDPSCENDRFRSNTPLQVVPGGEAVAKVCCFCLKHGNRISQQHFMTPGNEVER